ncbi:MAG TPA: hypothetical protein VJB02_03230 [Coxiellaceae bacterium]|nr:hypothetical protein [Coxiellaceae bacterium]
MPTDVELEILKRHLALCLIREHREVLLAKTSFALVHKSIEFQLLQWTAERLSMRRVSRSSRRRETFMDPSPPTFKAAANAVTAVMDLQRRASFKPFAPARGVIPSVMFSYRGQDFNAGEVMLFFVNVNLSEMDTPEAVRSAQNILLFLEEADGFLAAIADSEAAIQVYLAGKEIVPPHFEALMTRTLETFKSGMLNPLRLQTCAAQLASELEKAASRVEPPADDAGTGSTGAQTEADISFAPSAAAAESGGVALPAPAPIRAPTPVDALLSERREEEKHEEEEEDQDREEADVSQAAAAGGRGTGVPSFLRPLSRRKERSIAEAAPPKPPTLPAPKPEPPLLKISLPAWVEALSDTQLMDALHSAQIGEWSQVALWKPPEVFELERARVPQDEYVDHYLFLPLGTVEIMLKRRADLPPSIRP